MKKDFNSWNELKKKINDSIPLVNFKERDVWFMNMGANVRYEQDGKGKDFLRPVLVVKKFNKEMFWGVPCTSKDKGGKYYFYLGVIRGRKNTAILSQMRLFSSSRMVYKLGSVSENVFTRLIDSLTEFLEEAKLKALEKLTPPPREVGGRP